MRFLNGVGMSKKGFRQTKTGQYTGFIYFDPAQGKNVRIGKKDGWPSNVYSFEDAMKERGRILGKIDARLTEAKKRLDWMGRYQKFDEIIEEYENWIAKKAPNSYSTSLSYLKNYVLYWFLSEKALNNPEEWRRHYHDFVEWLTQENRALKLRTSNLSKNTINNIIKSLNALLTFLEEKHLLGPFARCKELQVGHDERRGLEALYSESETEIITKKLTDIDPKFSLFFRLLLKTGMRFNEAIGLHVDSFSFSIPKEKISLFKKFDEAEIPYYGFILLKDQPKLKQIFDAQGKVPRKPLKGRREISPLYNRYIPLIDEQITNEIVQLIESKIRSDVAGPDNLIFGFKKMEFYMALAGILKAMNLKEKDVHSCRHTFATWLTRKCGGDRSVSEDVLGHSSSEVNKRYVHLAEELEANRTKVKPGQKIQIKRLQA